MKKKEKTNPKEIYKDKKTQQKLLKIALLYSMQTPLYCLKKKPKPLLIIWVGHLRQHELPSGMMSGACDCDGAGHHDDLRLKILVQHVAGTAPSCPGCRTATGTACSCEPETE